LNHNRGRLKDSEEISIQCETRGGTVEEKKNITVTVGRICNTFLGLFGGLKQLQNGWI
jgi:hypothetical protein